MVFKSLFQIIKKKIVLFLSLIFITTIGVMFSTGFVSCYQDYKREAAAYINDYGLPDIILNINKTFSDDEVSEVDVPGAQVFYRYQIDLGVSINDKIYRTRLTTFDSNSFSKRYVVSEVEDSETYININLDYSFAHINNITAGTIATIKSAELELKSFYVNKLVGNPEAIEYSTGTIVPTDRYNFGFAYVDKADLKEKSPLLDINNQVIVKVIDSTKSKEEIYEALKTELSTKADLSVKSKIYKEDNDSYQFITYNDRDMKKIAIMVPLATIAILLIIVFLFMYQVSKSLTHEFGIMIALGNSTKSIVGLLLGFATAVSVVASALGILCGHFFSTIMYNVFKDSFYVPTGYGGVLWQISLYSFLGCLAITYLAVLSTVMVIRRISPLEAINNSKNEYKPLIKPVEKIVDKTGVSSKIAVSSIFKEKVRSFVSIFAIIASFTICFGALNLYQSENGLINQLYDRHNYTAEVYIKDKTKQSDVEEFVKKQKEEGVISDYENSKVAYVTFDGRHQLLFYGIQDSDMHKIVDANNNRISFDQKDTVVIDYYYAREYGFSKGETLTKNGKSFTVQEICHSCTYQKNYVNYETLKNDIVCDDYYETICIDTNDLDSFQNNVLKSNISAYVDVVNMYTYGQTITSGYQTLMMLAEGIVALGIIIGVSTLIIMAIVSMNEQKRKFSVMQTLGLKVSEVSKVIFVQNCVFSVVGLAIAIPCGMFFGSWLVKIATTKYTLLINYNHWWLYAIVAAVMLLIIAITHLISTIQIKRINLVANTCSRE